MIALYLMEDGRMVSMNPQRLHSFSFRSPQRQGLYQDDLIMRIASQIAMHIEELISLDPGKSSYIYNLPDGLRCPEACRIVEKHLREVCDATESTYEEDKHCIIIRDEALVTDARERVADQQRNAPVYDGVPSKAPDPSFVPASV